MSGSVAWYTARAAGIVAWLLLTASVLWGLVLSTRLTRRPPAKWVLDLHRFLGGLAVTFVVVHVLGLVADNFVPFGLADVLVPFASQWKPAAVALGVVSLWVLLAVELTSLLMRHLPRRTWRKVHMTSFGLFGLATLHALLAGTDTGNPAFLLAVEIGVGMTVFLTLVRVLSGRRPRRAPARRTVSA